MARKLMLSRAGTSLIRNYAGDKLVAMTSPMPYVQWDLGSLADVVRCDASNGAGYFKITCDEVDPLRVGFEAKFTLRMVWTGPQTITCSLSGSGTLFYADLYTWIPNVATPSTLSLAPGSASGNMSVPYYRYRIGGRLWSLDDPGAVGDWVRVDFFLS